MDTTPRGFPGGRVRAPFRSLVTIDDIYPDRPDRAG